MVARWRGRPALAQGAVVRRLGRAVRPLLATSRPAARMRVVTPRGVATAAPLYDARPIVDVFRRVVDDVVLGLMDVLARERPPK